MPFAANICWRLIFDLATMMIWCDKNNIKYIIGIAKNSRLEKQADHLIQKAQGQFEKLVRKAFTYMF